MRRPALLFTATTAIAASSALTCGESANRIRVVFPDQQRSQTRRGLVWRSRRRTPMVIVGGSLWREKA